MVRPVHTFLATLLALVLLAALAGAVSPPPGLVSWGEQSYRLDSGEATSFHVDFEQIPVRRWVLLVESDRTPSHLNVRRVADGSLVYDQRDEIRHEADVPWGDGESISAVLTAGRKGGVFSVSIWGPPRDSHLRSYRYEVNRALEAFARGDVGAARQHLLTAQHGGADDPVATLLLQGLEAGVTPQQVAEARAHLADGPATEAQRRSRRDNAARVAELRAGQQLYVALELLQGELEQPLPGELRAEVFADLTEVLLDLGSREQAHLAAVAAAELGLDGERLAELKRRLAP
jgi:hypothetical protein